MWGWIPNGILAAGPSRVTMRRKATADIGAPRSLMKTYRPGFCSRWRRRRARSSMPVSGWTEGIPLLSRWTCRRPWTRNYVTSPPSETASNLADFHQRQGHAPRFAGKGREIAPGRCRMGRYEGRSAGWLRASSQRVEGVEPTPWHGKPPPPQKSRPPSGPPGFSSYRCRSRAPNRAFFVLVFEVALHVTAPLRYA
jgi:hypothetical protein